MKHEQVKKLTVLAMLCAVAYVIVALVRIPVVMFLKYEPKDVIIAFGGFLYGPLAALIVTTVVSFIEMLTVSTTGWIGLIMNILSTAAFAQKAHTFGRGHRSASRLRGNDGRNAHLELRTDAALHGNGARRCRRNARARISALQSSQERAEQRDHDSSLPPARARFAPRRSFPAEQCRQ